MTKNDDPWYDRRLNREENSWLNKLQRIDPDGDHPPAERTDRLLKIGPLDISITVRGRRYAFAVDAPNWVFGSAEVCLDVWGTLLSDETSIPRAKDQKSITSFFQKKPDNSPPLTRAAKSVAKTPSPVLEAEKSQGEESLPDLVEECAGDQPVSWSETRAKVVPSYVQDIIFTIPERDLTKDRLSQLEKEYPGVTIKQSPIPKVSIGTQTLDETETSVLIEPGQGSQNCRLLEDRYDPPLDRRYAALSPASNVLQHATPLQEQEHTVDLSYQAMAATLDPSHQQRRKNGTSKKRTWSERQSSPNRRVENEQVPAESIELQMAQGVEATDTLDDPERPRTHHSADDNTALPRSTTSVERTDVPSKRGPGRPRKYPRKDDEKSATSFESTDVPRGPGRPRKKPRIDDDKSATSFESTDVPRGPGRPRKKPRIDDDKSAAKPEPTDTPRKRGRPKKNPRLDEDNTIVRSTTSAESTDTPCKRGRPNHLHMLDDKDAGNQPATELTPKDTMTGALSQLTAYLDHSPLNPNFDEVAEEFVRHHTQEKSGVTPLPETPQRHDSNGVEVKSERKSARVQAPPAGYYCLKPRKNQFKDTMWDGFIAG